MPPPPKKNSHMLPNQFYFSPIRLLWMRAVKYYWFATSCLVCFYLTGPIFFTLFFYCLIKRFNSLELIAQVSFPDHLSFLFQSCKYYTFSSSFPQQLLLGQFQLNLTQSILGWKWVRFVYMKGLFQRGDNS